MSYDGLVVPGAVLLLASGAWMIIKFYGGWSFLQISWLAGMIFLFAFEFIEGNTSMLPAYLALLCAATGSVGLAIFTC